MTTTTILQSKLLNRMFLPHSVSKSPHPPPDPFPNQVRPPYLQFEHGWHLINLALVFTPVRSAFPGNDTIANPDPAQGLLAVPLIALAPVLA